MRFTIGDLTQVYYWSGEELPTHKYTYKSIAQVSNVAGWGFWWGTHFLCTSGSRSLREQHVTSLSGTTYTFLDFITT